jgi:hypothetical protein
VVFITGGVVLDALETALALGMAGLCRARVAASGYRVGAALQAARDAPPPVVRSLPSIAALSSMAADQSTSPRVVGRSTEGRLVNKN